MRHTTLLLPIALCVILTPVSAQETLIVPASAQPSQIQQNDPAEAAWQNLQTQLSGKRQDAPGQAISQAQQQPSVSPSLTAQTTQAAIQPQPAIDWASIARQSRDYLAQYPDGRHVSEARKLELTAELVPLYGAGNISPAVEAGVRAYLSDTAMPASARFEVSAMHKNARMTLREGMSRDEVMSQRLQNARELVTEFPSDPRAWVGLINGAQFTPGQAGSDAATAIIASPDAPDNVKQAAQTMLKKRALLDKPVGCVDLSFAGNQPIMIYFWSINRPDFLSLFRHYKKIDGIAFLGINVDDESKRTQAEKFAVDLDLPGTQIYDGAGGPLAKALYITKSPAMLLVDGHGILRDIDGNFNTLGKLKQMAGDSAKASATPAPPDSGTGGKGSRQ